MKYVDWVIDMVFESMKYGVRDIMLFPGEGLRGPLKFCAMLFVLSLAGQLTHTLHFVNPLGAALGTALLACLYFIGKGE